MTTISLENLERILQENLHQLQGSTPSKYVLFPEFIASNLCTHEIDLIADLSIAFDGFNDRYRRLYYNQKLFHEKANILGHFLINLPLEQKKLVLL